MKRYNWGIIGAGWIAGKFAEDLRLLPQAELKAIASRSGNRSAEFARRYSLPVYYGSWEEMAADPDIDVVYVATHHPYHFENSLACLNAGKSVLCEKPFTMNTRELQELVRAARKNGVFLMEAIWTRFLPSMNKVLEIAKSGELGTLKEIHADFGIRREFDPEHRLFDPAKAGGALLDIGIYTVFLSQLLCGPPREIKAEARFAPTGIDHSCHMIFVHRGGPVSSLNCSFLADTPTEASLVFDGGWVRMESMWFTPGPITLHLPDREPQRIEFPEPGNGYRYEAEELMRCLDEGLQESPLLPLDFSLELMETLDRVRSICGIRYEQDQPYNTHRK